jgi:hypothetical protein
MVSSVSEIPPQQKSVHKNHRISLMKKLFKPKVTQSVPEWLIEEPFKFEQPFAPSHHCIAYDIEVYKNYFCCVIIGKKNEPRIFTLDDLTDMCLTLADKRFVMVGFNNLFYDDYVMKYIFMDQRQSLTPNLINEFGMDDLHDRLFKLSGSMINSGKGPKPNWYWDLWRMDVPWGFSMDTFKVPKPLLGLKERACERHTVSIEESPIPFDAEVTPKDIQGINDYCINDVQETIKEFNESVKHIQLRKKLLELYPNAKIISEHDPGVCEQIITSEYLKRTKLEKKYVKGKISRPGKKINIKECIPPWVSFHSEFLAKNIDRLSMFTGKFSTDQDRACLNHVIDFKNQKVLTDPGLFEEDEEGVPLNKIIRGWREEDGFAVKMAAGGLHSIDWPSIIEPKDNEMLFEIDVASFYPGLIRSMQLKPAHMSEHFNDILNGITEMRLKAKAEKDVLVSEALKIVINSAFGKTGNQYSILFDEKMQLQVTLGGQISLLMLIEQLLAKKINIVSANTDGIVILIPKSKKFIVDSIRKKWEKATGQVLEESQYKKYVRRDVNNYLVVKDGGKTKEKGIFKIRKPEKNIRKQRNKAEILAESLREYFINGVTPAEYIMDCSDLRKFIYSFHASGEWGLYQKLLINNQLEYRRILNASRWYISKEVDNTLGKGYKPSERVGDIVKIGPMTDKEKQRYRNTNKTDRHPNNWLKEINVENGKNAALINRLPDKFPEDLDYIHYIISVKKRIKEVEG